MTKKLSEMIDDLPEDLAERVGSTASTVTSLVISAQSVRDLRSSGILSIENVCKCLSEIWDEVFKLRLEVDALKRVKLNFSDEEIKNLRKAGSNLFFNTGDRLQAPDHFRILAQAFVGQKAVDAAAEMIAEGFYEAEKDWIARHATSYLKRERGDSE